MLTRLSDATALLRSRPRVVARLLVVSLLAALASACSPRGPVRAPEAPRAGSSRPALHRPLARCVPQDRAFAAGVDPVDLALLVVAGEGPALVIANEGSGDLSRMVRDGDRWREVQRVASGPGPFALAVADIDGDARPDVAALHREPATVSLHLSRPDGGLGEARRIALDEPAQAIAIADLDGDGRAELVVATGAALGAGTVRVIALDAAGAADAEARVAVKRAPTAVAVGDVLGDPRPEIAAFHLGASVQAIVTRSGGGALRWDQRELLGPGCCVAHATTAGVLADLVGDAHLEAAFVSLGATPERRGELVVARDEGQGVFMATATTSVAPAPHRVLVRDVDGDGMPEILVFAGVAATRARFRAMLEWNDDEAADLPMLEVYAPVDDRLERRAQVAVDGRAFVVHDLDGDGTLDLAAVLGRLHVRDDIFAAPPPRRSFAHGVLSLAAFDVDGDGDDEVVVAREDGCAVVEAREAVVLRPLAASERAPAGLCLGSDERGAGAPVLAVDRDGLALPRARGRPESLPLNAHATVRDLGAVRRQGASAVERVIAIRDATGGGPPELRRPVVDDASVRVLLVRGDRDDELVQLATLRDDVDDVDAAARQAALRRARWAGHASDVLAVAAGDLDGDGHVELLLLDRRQQLHALWGRDDDGFAPAVRWDLAPVHALAVGDLDGDGVDELVTLSRQDAALQIFAPVDANTPVPAATLGVAAGARTLAVADVSGDGEPELVVGDGLTGEVDVVRLLLCGGAITSAAARAGAPGG